MTAVRHSVPSDSDASYDVTDDLQDKPTDSRTSQTVNSARIHRAEIHEAMLKRGLAHRGHEFREDELHSASILCRSERCKFGELPSH